VVTTPVTETPVVAAAPSGKVEIIDIAVPDIGEDGEVDVIDVLVSEGDVIEEEDGLITLETDKATMDVPSSHAGTVKEVFISNGDRVKQGSLVIKLEITANVDAAMVTPAPAPAIEIDTPAPTVVAAPSEPVSAPAAPKVPLYLTIPKQVT
jgi:pyruvate dehydrogenase E2 component (dihydrolipoamide acetyltransferase)